MVSSNPDGFISWLLLNKAVHDNRLITMIDCFVVLSSLHGYRMFDAWISDLHFVYQIGDLNLECE